MVTSVILGGSIIPRSVEDAAGDERLGNATYSRDAAVREHLSLFFAVQEIVVLLHGDEFVPGQCQLRQLRQLRQLQSIHTPLASHHPLVLAMFCYIWNSHAAIKLAPIYLTFPLSTTSFNAFMISFFGVSLSDLCNVGRKLELTHHCSPYLRKIWRA